MSTYFSTFPVKKKVEAPPKAKKQKTIQHKNQLKPAKAESKGAVGDVLTRDLQKLGKIVQFLLGESMALKQQDGRKFSSILTEEEARLQQSYIKDLNIGHFVIVVDNPDNLYSLSEETRPKPVNCKDMIELYCHYFGMSSSEIKLSELEEVAFYISFLAIRQETSPAKDLVKDAETAFRAFRFFENLNFVHINPLDFEARLLQYSNSTRLEERHPSLRKAFLQLLKLRKENSMPESGRIQNLVNNLRKDYEIWLAKLLSDSFKDSKLVQFLSNFKELGQLISSFGDIFLGEAISLISEEMETLKLYSQREDIPEGIIEKRMVDGGFIGTMLDERDAKKEIRILNSRPGDFNHLLRNALIYKLSNRCKLIVRQFLSQDTLKIFIVAKSGQVQLSKFYSKLKIPTETELGAVHLLSLQPVDKKLRPLRVHKYIRESAFQRKYNLIGHEDVSILFQSEDTRVENNLLKTYADSLALNEDELRCEVIKQQAVVDKIFNQISNEMEQDYITPGYIADEAEVSMDEWQAYYLYQKLLIDNYKVIKEPALRKCPAKEIQHSQFFRVYRAMIYRLLLVKSQAVANRFLEEQQGLLSKVASCSWLRPYTPLKSLWDRIRVQHFSPFVNFIDKNRLSGLWRKYESNELKERTNFKESDCLVIVDMLINSVINVESAVKYGFVKDYFPLHNPYALRGVKVQPFVYEFVNQAKEPPQSEQQEQQQMRVTAILERFKAEAWEDDFRDKSIEEVISFRWKDPVYVPLGTLNSYLGPKLTLMFYFKQVFVLSMNKFQLVAFILQCLLWASTSSYAQMLNLDLTNGINGIIVILAYIIAGWTAQLGSEWAQAETAFKKKFGTEQSSSVSKERLQFKGQFRRNLTDDELNFKSQVRLVRVLKLCLTALVNFGYLGITVLTIILIFYLKKYMIKTSCCSNSVVSTLPTLLISISINVFTTLYSKIAGPLTVFQNHKYLDQYENSKIFNSYLINLVTNFNSLFIVSFLSTYFTGLGLCQVQVSADLFTNDCSAIVQGQMFSTFMVNLALTVLQIVLPLANYGAKTIFSAVDPDLRLAPNQFQSLEHYIEEQARLSGYKSDPEIDGTLDDYLNTLVDFTYVAFFGLSFPLCFLIASLIAILRIHFIKLKLLFLLKRPIPSRVQSIGFWKVLIEGISYAGIFVNIFYLVYTRTAFKFSSSNFFIFFLTFTLLLVRYFFSQISTDKFKQFHEIAERQANIVNGILLKSKGKDLNNLRQGKLNEFGQGEGDRDQDFDKLVQALDLHRQKQMLCDSGSAERISRDSSQLLNSE